MAANGEKLKAARLKQGKSVQDIAQLTRISPAFLEAIEENQLEKIPGNFFRRSFLKQYAEALGLNPDEFQPDEAMEFRSFGGDDVGGASGVRLHEPPDLPPLPPLSGRRTVPVRQILLSIGLLVGVLALCAVAYTLWEDAQLGRDRQQATMEDSLSPPIPGLDPTPETAQDASEGPAESQSDQNIPAASPEARTEVASSTASPTTAPQGEPTSASPAEQPTTAAEPAPRAVFGEGARELRLSASAPTWVQAREGEKTVYTGVIQPGQSRILRVAEGARLVVGNAGGLSLMWQGETMEAVGPLGQVRIVNVTLDGVSVAAPERRPTGDQQDNST